ncbi:MAG: hypothetical protein IPP94_01610 [Ignavibacteria bacterium]|nr:hypothetical protein [Ignavibacteria bacterium]
MTPPRLCIVLVLAAAALHPTADAVAQYALVNQYAVFDGSSYLSVAYTPAFNSGLSQGAEFAIDAWVYPTSFSGYPTVVGNDYSSGFWLGFNLSGYLRFYPSGAGYYESSTAVPLNQWTHIAVSYTVGKATVRFFINGALDATITGVGVTIGMANGDLRIGADRNGNTPAYFFNGRMDEVRIWSSIVDFAAAPGELYRTPHEFAGGLHGKALLAAWRLNGDGVDSAYAQNASPVGTMAYGNASPPPHYTRMCAVFENDGNTGHDFFSVPSSASLSMTANYTLECWAFLAGNGASTSYQTFLSKGMSWSSSLQYWLGVNKQNGRLRFAPTGVFGTAIESADPLPVNQWVHVAATFSASGSNGTARLYVNGQPKGSASIPNSGTANAFPLFIATADQQALPATAYALAGRLDEARIWSVARSDAEIANTWRMELSGPVSGLSASYHFDGDVLDHSAGGNHGTNANSSSLGLYFRDASDLPSLPSLTLTAPNGGENWPIGSSRAVTWNSDGLGSVRLELSRDGGASYTETIAPSLSAPAGSHSWTVTGPEGALCSFRVSSATVPSLSDQSNADFAITQPPPVLAVAPNALAFTAVQNGALPSTKTLHIANTGGGALSWTASASSLWLSLTPGFGALNSDSTIVGIATTMLPAGTLHDTIVFSGNANNVPLRIPVSLDILATPHIDTDPASVQFNAQPGVNPPSKTVHVLNSGTGTLAWTAASTVPWLSVAPNAGGQGDSITLSVSVAALAPGTHTGGVTIAGNADNSPKVLLVQLVISTQAYYPVAGMARSGSTPLAGVRIDVAGDSVLSLLTGADGSFSIGGLRAGAYSVSASSPFYAFTPASYALSPLNAPRLDLVFDAGPKQGAAVVQYRKGWNLLSLPVDPDTRDITALFPDASTPALAYRYSQDSGYIAETQLHFGTGYWIKFSKTDSVSIVGSMRGDFRVPLTGGMGGWNLIGGASGAVPIAAIVQSPPGSLVTIYQFNPGEGYRLPAGDILRHGLGYFVKVRNDALFTLISSFTGSREQLEDLRAPSSLPDVLGGPPAGPEREVGHGN